MQHKLSLLLLILTFLPVSAKVRLSHLMSNDMILQQQSDVNLWGWAASGKSITVTTSWDNATYTTRAGKDGAWKVAVKTPAASNTPYEVTFSDGEETTLTGVLIGEVWVCAGQSNMEMTLSGFGNCPVEGYAEAITTAAQHKNIHFVKVPSIMSSEPQADTQCEWKGVTPETVGDCSAVGYYFARVINRALDIPVGLLMANKGGSRVESWLSRENLTKHTDENLDSLTMTKTFQWDFHYPLLWGNGTFYPILNYGVKGILYYQGCSNVGNPAGQYTTRLALLAKQWREAFGRGDIPFYIVEIAPYIYGDGPDGISGALLREQQANASDIIPNSAIVSTNDCVYPFERNQIHPTQKQPVGERLAGLALNREYGYSKLQAECMRYKDMDIQGDTCFIRFNNTYGGVSRYEDIEGFEVAGEDRVLHKAVAGHYYVPGYNVHNEAVYVTSPEVKKPVAVRYCFRNFMIGNLGNNAQLPLIPFRTDNW